MGLLKVATDWFIDRSEAKLNKKETDCFDLYRYKLAQEYSQAKIERIKVLYDEWRRLEDKLIAHEITPPSSRDINRMIHLQLFFNDLDSVEPSQMDEELKGLEYHDRKALQKRIQEIREQKAMQLEQRVGAKQLDNEKSLQAEKVVMLKDKDRCR